MRADGHRQRLGEFERAVRARGLALTVQRRAVFEALLERADHPTADQVYEAVRERIPGVSRTTVYRVLDALVGARVIAKVGHLGSAVRYDPLTHRHHHLVCLRCEKVVDFEDQRLNALPLPRLRGGEFTVSGYSVQFQGVCAACRARSETESGTARRGRKRTASDHSGREKVQTFKRRKSR